MDEKVSEMLRAAKTEEEALKILADQKIELSDEELEELRGGSLYGIECATACTVISSIVITIVD